MAFIDELKIHISAGKGGDGVVRWLHEKNRDHGGPSGGNGGNGGSVYVRGVRDIGLFSRYANKKEFLAENGVDGSKNSKFGRNGDDLIIDLPIGSVVKNMKTGKFFSLLKEGEEVLVLKGGVGGLGNEHFKASTNIKPEESTPGRPGEEADFEIELEMVVDVGLIGFPNAGKSSLLNVLTRANAKVGDYKFTTLEPNVGDHYGVILADIPGLIEGASEGRGLGHKFLRHIKRTNIIAHCVSAEEGDVLGAYNAIRDELGAYSPELLEKREIVLLTKTDTVTAEEVTAKIKALSGKGLEVVPVSIYDDVAIKELSKVLTGLIKVQ
jgi:GTP-binding protein